MPKARDWMNNNSWVVLGDRDRPVRRAHPDRTWSSRQPYAGEDAGLLGGQLLAGQDALTPGASPGARARPRGWHPESAPGSASDGAARPATRRSRDSRIRSASDWAMPSGVPVETWSGNSRIIWRLSVSMPMARTHDQDQRRNQTTRGDHRVPPEQHDQDARKQPVRVLGLAQIGRERVADGGRDLGRPGQPGRDDHHDAVDDQRLRRVLQKRGPDIPGMRTAVSAVDDSLKAPTIASPPAFRAIRSIAPMAMNENPTARSISRRQPRAVQIAAA